MDLPFIHGNYSLEVSEEMDGDLVYGLKNVKTGVFEYKDTILPRIYQSLLRLNEEYEQMMRTIEGVNEPVQLALIDNDELEKTH